MENNWESVRGSAIKYQKPKSDNYINKLIIYKIEKELGKYSKQYKITNKNKYAKWKVI